MSKPQSKGFQALQVERMAAGEIPVAPEFAEETASCAEDNESILSEFPKEEVAAEVMRRYRKDVVGTKRNKQRKLLWVAPITVAFAAVLFFLRWDGQDHSQLGEFNPSPIRYKGEARLLAYPFGEESAQPLANGASLAEGDRIQLAYLAAGQRYGAIFSVDGRGVITRHLPERGARAFVLEQERSLLQHSYELDDAPLFERFYFITSDSDFEIALVERAIEEWSKKASLQALLALPDSLQEQVLHFSKE